MERRINAALKNNFRPEFLDRIDEKIIFNRLKNKDLCTIVNIQINILKDRLKEKNITIELSEKMKAFLGQKGYDPTYGVRPLKRVIQKLVQDDMAIRISHGEILEKDHVPIDVTLEGGVSFLMNPRVREAVGSEKTSASRY